MRRSTRLRGPSMLARLWPSPSAMLATGLTATGFHATPFWVAVYSSVVGACVAAVGFWVQTRRWKREDAADKQTTAYINHLLNIIELNARERGEDLTMTRPTQDGNKHGFGL